MSYVLLSPYIETLFRLWVLILCSLCFFTFVHAFITKKYLHALLLLPFFIQVYWFRQIIFVLKRNYQNQEISAFCEWFGRLSWGWWFILLLVPTFAILFIHINILRTCRKSITPQVILTCSDKMPFGMCYWRDGGRVIFSNACMEKISQQITGHPIKNGELFRKAITGDVITIGQTIWRFTSRELLFDGEPLHELIASDVTELYKNIEELRKEEAEYARISHELHEYNLSIDDVVRHQEILQAKINIHDEMNRLILTTNAADTNDTENLDRIFTLWQRNALLLCMESNNNQQTADYLQQITEALGVKLIWNSPLPSSLTDKQRELFFTTAQEAIANAVKHANMKNLLISFMETNEDLTCIFENDVRITSEKSEPKPEGSLSNLSRLAAAQQAEIFIESGATFKLGLRFRK